MMRRLILLPLAGALLIGGAAVTAAAPELVSDATTAVVSGPARAGTLLGDVLAELVEQGVISQAQSDAITGELDARFEERRAEMEARHDEMRAIAEHIRGFLADDVITAEEVAQLPDSELRSALEGLLQDGDITVERLRELGGFGFPLRGPGQHGPGHRFLDQVRPAPDPALEWQDAETDSQGS